MNTSGVPGAAASPTSGAVPEQPTAPTPPDDLAAPGGPVPPRDPFAAASGGPFVAAAPIVPGAPILPGGAHAGARATDGGADAGGSAPAEGDAGAPAAVEGPGAGVRVLAVAFRTAGAVLSVVMAVLSGLLELYFAPLRLGGTLVGVSALFAVVANLGLAWFAVHTVGRRWALALPWVPWTVLMFVAAGVRTAEGDHLLGADNWVGMALVLLGTVAFAAYAYRRILAPPP